MYVLVFVVYIVVYILLNVLSLLLDEIRIKVYYVMDENNFKYIVLFVV